jgi:hypothetical protein
MSDSMQSIRIRGINEGHPPTTAEWNEHEARQGAIGPQRSRPANGGPRRGPTPLPMLTDEQIVGNAKWLHARLVLLLDALDGEEWDGRWNNRLMAAWLSARRSIRDAATWKGQDDGVARLVEGDQAEEDKPAAGDNPADGSGSQAGEA